MPCPQFLYTWLVQKLLRPTPTISSVALSPKYLCNYLYEFLCCLVTYIVQCYVGRYLYECLFVRVVQGCPEKLSRVKVGTQGQGGYHSESQLQPSCIKKRSLHADNDNSCPSPAISPYLYAYYTAPLKNTETSLLEYLDPHCSIRVSGS